MSTKDFSKLKKVVENFIAPGSTSKTREAIDNRVQGFVISPEVILAEIKKSYSPFQSPAMKGIVSGNLSKIAQEISDEIWKLLKSAPKAIKASYQVAGGKIPTNFLYGEDKAVAYDEAQRIFYIRSRVKSKSTSYKDLGTVMTEVKNKVREYPATNYTKIFLLPTQAWLDQLERIKDEIEAETPGIGRVGKAVENRVKRKLDQQGTRDLPQFKGTNQLGQSIGHTFGAGATKAAGFLNDPHGIQNLDLEKPFELISTIPKEFNSRVQFLLKELILADTRIEYERKFDSKGGTGRITITVWEDTIANAKSGTAVQSALKKLDLLAKEIQATIELEELKGSPSYRQLLQLHVEDLFLGKKIVSKLFKTSTVIKGKKQNISIPITKIAGAQVKVDAKRARKEKGKVGDLTKLLFFLNSKLHDKIRENMGKGGSKQTLNYRTGRFARSAKIMQLLPGREANMIEAQVKYMRNPYGVFEIGGRLNPPKLRDPAGIFGRSIRQLLQEHKIATLRRVRVTLRD